MIASLHRTRCLTIGPSAGALCLALQQQGRAGAPTHSSARKTNGPVPMPHLRSALPAAFTRTWTCSAHVDAPSPRPSTGRRCRSASRRASSRRVAPVICSGGVRPTAVAPFSSARLLKLTQPCILPAPAWRALSLRFAAVPQRTAPLAACRRCTSQHSPRSGRRLAPGGDFLASAGPERHMTHLRKIR